MNRADRITDVRAYVIDQPPRTAGESGDDEPEAVRHWRRGKVAHPLSRYPEFRDNRPAALGPSADQTVVVEVESASGAVGIGTTNGGVACAAVVESHLAHLVEGEEPTAHERIWDRMFHSTLLYGRKGLVLHALSAVDLAVWDLHGRLTQLPVYALLGGPVREQVEVYATGPRPDIAEQLGFWGAKLPLTWAASEGEDGLANNLAAAAKARSSVGEDFPLLLDCWMSLDVDYAARLADALDGLGFRWLEEPLPPDEYDAHRRLRARLPGRMALATGEHEYTAAGFALLCDTGVDVIQPDPGWCGGLTELRRIAAVARTRGTRLIPHVGGHYSYHFAMAYPEVSLAEFPMLTGACDRVTPQHRGFLGETAPVDGHVRLDDSPGFGLTLDPATRRRRPIEHEPAGARS
ncbi:MAG TPA: L-rhamnonate dehydratase [Rugosimonospora sp.]